MLFNSLEFLLFLPITFVLYWFVFKQRTQQNILIVIVSYIFYGYWDWKFLLLIATTTILSYISGLLINRYRIHYGKTISIVNIICNLGILGIFKYYNFFAESLQTILHNFGIETNWTTLNIILPVGISFYTFQALSYSIDVYNRRINACRDIASFFAYVSFFPQLVAGPIERATSLLPQFLNKRQFNYTAATDGCRQILWGLFKKMVIADRCAYIVNEIWSDYTTQSSLTLALAAILFSFQIYGDFSGYSDIAIGTGRIFGINLMRNFNFPYFSRDIAEFWRRWHISLTTWFRDYVYIPLGGSRRGKIITLRNTIIIFLVSGLWHGANWTFVSWGIFHALLFVPLLLLQRNHQHTNTAGDRRILPSLREIAQIALTFVLVTIGWIIFRAENIGQALDFTCCMLTNSGSSANDITCNTDILVILVIFVTVEWLQRNKQHALQLPHVGIFRHRLLRYTLYYALALFILIFQGFASDFIYFQF